MKKIKPKVKSLGLSKGFETINYSCGCSYSGEKIDGFFAAKIKSGNKITDSLEMSVTIASLLEGIGSRSFLHA